MTLKGDNLRIERLIPVEDALTQAQISRLIVIAHETKIEAIRAAALHLVHKALDPMLIVRGPE